MQLFQQKCRGSYSQIFIFCFFYIWRVALLRIPRQPNYRFGKNRFCRQSAPRKGSGRTDYINLRHFPVHVFSVENKYLDLTRSESATIVKFSIWKFYIWREAS